MRAIARDGTVSTLPDSGPKTASGVAAFGGGASLVVYAGLDGHALRLLFCVRQPATVGVLVGAWLGFWLGARPADSRSTH